MANEPNNYEVPICLHLVGIYLMIKGLYKSQMIYIKPFQPTWVGRIANQC